MTREKAIQKELWLLRHAKSDRHAKGEDINRPLKKRGIRDATNMGIWLRNQKLSPDVILCSPAKRAFDTANLIFNANKVENENDAMIVLNEALYDSDLDKLKHILSGYEETVHKIVLVGHNPELELFLRYLLGQGALPENEKLFPTCALFRLSLTTRWHELSAQQATLISVTYPKMLLD